MEMDRTCRQEGQYFPYKICIALGTWGQTKERALWNLEEDCRGKKWKAWNIHGELSREWPKLGKRGGPLLLPYMPAGILGNKYKNHCVLINAVPLCYLHSTVTFNKCSSAWAWTHLGVLPLQLRAVTFICCLFAPIRSKHRYPFLRFNLESILGV